MYRVISPEWNEITIKAGFKTAKAARKWAKEHCGTDSCWEGIWQVEYYNPNPFIMTV